MSSVTSDPFDSIRAGLLLATARDLRRSRRRRHAASVAAVIAVTVIFLTGIAAAANDDVARFIKSVPSSTVLDVFTGAANQEPSPESEQAFEDMYAMEVFPLGRERMAPNPARKLRDAKVLLKDRIDGVDVEIVAARRATRDKRYAEETCWAVSETGGPAGSITCSPEMMPGLPVNYGAGWRTGIVPAFWTVTISGITDDTVASMEAVTNRGIEPITMGDHAFWWRSRPFRQPQALRIHLRTGETIETEIEQPTLPAGR